MWKLKYRCPLHGNGFIMYLMLPVSICLGFLIPPHGGLTVLIAMPIFMLLAFVGVFLWSHRLTQEEKELIEYAEMPLWEPLSELEIEQIREEPRQSIGGFIVLLGFLILADIFLPFWSRSDPFLSVLFLILGLYFTIRVCLKFYNSSVWTNVDDSAGAIIVPIAERFTRFKNAYGGTSYRAGRYRKTERTVEYNTYMVFYLPDGKYVLPCAKGEFPEQVRIVRFHNHFRVTAIEPEDKNGQMKIDPAIYTKILSR